MYVSPYYLINYPIVYLIIYTELIIVKNMLRPNVEEYTNLVENIIITGVSQSFLESKLFC